MLDGYEIREDRAWRRTAQLAAWILAPWSKKKLTGDDLLGKRRPAAPIRVRRPRAAPAPVPPAAGPAPPLPSRRAR